MKGLIKKLLREGLEESTFKSELKGRNLLFHSVVANSIFFNILTDNTIEGRTKQEIITSGGKDKVTGVSLSRDSEFYWGEYQFILDGDLIKRDFGKKLRPFDFIKGAKPKSHPSRNHWSSGKLPTTYKKNDKGFYDEIGDYEEVNGNHIIAPSNPQSEEFLIGPLTNLRKYLLGVRFRDDNKIIRFNDEELTKMSVLFKNIPVYDKHFKSISFDNIANADRVGDHFISRINNDERTSQNEIIYALKNSPKLIDKIIENGIDKLDVYGDVFKNLIILTKEVSKIIKSLNEKQLESFLFLIISTPSELELIHNNQKVNNINFAELIKPYVINYLNNNENLKERYGNIIHLINRLK